jgi:predicted RNase H-like nuclease (RuvC/YqgF family)
MSQSRLEMRTKINQLTADNSVLTYNLKQVKQQNEKLYAKCKALQAALDAVLNTLI